jgi:hypothetical protein
MVPLADHAEQQHLPVDFRHDQPSETDQPGQNLGATGFLGAAGPVNTQIRVLTQITVLCYHFVTDFIEIIVISAYSRFVIVRLQSAGIGLICAHFLPNRGRKSAGTAGCASG